MEPQERRWLVRTFGHITRIAFSSGNEVSTPTPADASGLTVQSTDAGTHKINGLTLKPFSRVQVEDKLKEAHLLFEETFLVID